MNMAIFEINFDSTSLKELDQFALLACQEYNYGNSTDWFGSFRGGLYGLYSRLNAAQKHYYEVHAWIPLPRKLADAEYHLASLFFFMDSAIECMTFALNALGNCVSATEFRDVTDERSLRKIRPNDILGDTKNKPLIGYGNFFPSLQAHWQKNSSLIQQVLDQHDVSKHRETIFKGGKVRSDAPPGFYKSIGIDIDDKAILLFHPFEEINLHPDPKSPRVSRIPTPLADQLHLEPLANAFCDFMNESAQLAITDAKANISLNQNSFLK